MRAAHHLAELRPATKVEPLAIDDKWYSHGHTIARAFHCGFNRQPDVVRSPLAGNQKPVMATVAAIVGCIPAAIA